MITDDRLDKKLQELEGIVEWLINTSVSLKTEIQKARSNLNPDPKKVNRKAVHDQETKRVLAKINAKIFGRK